MNDAKNELKRQLQIHTTMVRSMGARPNHTYSCGEEMVLRHGRWYRGPWKGRFAQAPPKSCYGTAGANAAIHGYPYVEGYGISVRGEVFPHAWNVDEDGDLLDCVWLNTGAAYLGIEFSVERADDATWHGDASVLSDSRDDYRFFRDPWSGEDRSIAWPPSERLDLLRGGRTADNLQMAQQWLDANEQHFPDDPRVPGLRALIKSKQ